MEREVSERRSFLLGMIKEAMIPYECPGEKWSPDEKEFLPIFMDLMKPGSLILDLAGGYGRVTPHLIAERNDVILVDLSVHSLRLAKKTLKAKVDLVRSDMLNLPFRKNLFNGVWLTQAFEYVPPDFRKSFLGNLRKTMKKGSILFINIEHVPNGCSLISYLKNYVYWKLIKRAPVRWGDYIYKLDLEHYKGWHYHSIVFTRKIEKTFEKVGFQILKFKNYGKKGYLAYILQVK